MDRLEIRRKLTRNQLMNEQLKRKKQNLIRIMFESWHNRSWKRISLIESYEFQCNRMNIKRKKMHFCNWISSFIKSRKMTRLAIAQKRFTMQTYFSLYIQLRY